MSKQTNKRQVEKAREMRGKHEIRSKEEKRAKSDGVRGKYCDRLERLQLSGPPSLFGSLNQVWWHRARCVRVCVCVCVCVYVWGVIGCGCVHARVCCAGGRIWHPVSKLACEGEGTLRFQGYFVFPLFLKNFSVFSTWFHFTHTCCFMEKKGTFLQIELSYSFSNVFFFLRKQKYAFFSLHLLSKQS